MRKTFSLLIACCLLGCSIESGDVEDKISYIQDPKTELCFAHGSVFVNFDVKNVFTNVPCTDKVLEQIKKK